MKWIKYQIICNENENILITKKVSYSEANLEIAKKEALNGSYIIEQDDDITNIKKDSLIPIIAQVENHNMSFPGIHKQLQNMAIIRQGVYIYCKTGLFTGDQYTGTEVDNDSAIAILPVESGKTYTIMLPGVSHVETLLDAIALRTFKSKFLAFVGLNRYKFYDEKGISRIDLNYATPEELAEWLNSSELKMDGYSSYITGSMNSGKFNSYYYVTFTVPDEVDTVVFNIALSENTPSSKQYNYTENFFVFEGTKDDFERKSKIKFVTQLGDYYIRDLETSYKSQTNEYMINSIINDYLTPVDISEDFIASIQEGFECERYVFKYGKIIQGVVVINPTTGSFESAENGYFDNIFEINNKYASKGTAAVQTVALGDIDIADKPSCLALIGGTSCAIKCYNYDFNSINISFAYISE